MPGTRDTRSIYAPGYITAYFWVGRKCGSLKHFKVISRFLGRSRNRASAETRVQDTTKLEDEVEA